MQCIKNEQQQAALLLVQFRRLLCYLQVNKQTVL